MASDYYMSRQLDDLDKVRIAINSNLMIEVIRDECTYKVRFIAPKYGDQVIAVGRFSDYDLEEPEED